MEFNEMKMIWDSQNQEPLYAMNEAALHAVVQRKNQEWNRCLSRCFAGEITVGLVCGALMAICAGALGLGDPAWLATLPWMKIAASRWDILALLAAGGIWFYYSAYMFLARKRQQRRVEVFDSSLRGDLERALAQTDFQIALARSIVWWGLIPGVGGRCALGGHALSPGGRAGLDLRLHGSRRARVTRRRGFGETRVDHEPISAAPARTGIAPRQARRSATLAARAVDHHAGPEQEGSASAPEGTSLS